MKPEAYRPASRKQDRLSTSCSTLETRLEGPGRCSSAFDLSFRHPASAPENPSYGNLSAIRSYVAEREPQLC